MNYGSTFDGIPLNVYGIPVEDPIAQYNFWTEEEKESFLANHGIDYASLGDASSVSKAEMIRHIQYSEWLEITHKNDEKNYLKIKNNWRVRTWPRPPVKK